MSRAILFSIRINMQNNARDLAPFRTLCVGIEQSQIGHQMFLIVCRQGRSKWRHVCDIGVERGVFESASWCSAGDVRGERGAADEGYVKV
jgi:transcriptional regulator with XRE-family HTH domain